VLPMLLIPYALKNSGTVNSLSAVGAIFLGRVVAASRNRPL
jgi:hypothetical protein